MSTVTVTLNTTVAALPGVQPFNMLRLTLTGAGTPKTFDMTAAYISANAVDQGGGSFTIPAQFSGVAPGNYTVTAQAYDVEGQPMGSPVSGTGNMPAGMGAGYMQPVSLTSVAS